jgi:hypothetical protein
MERRWVNRVAQPVSWLQIITVSQRVEITWVMYLLGVRAGSSFIEKGLFSNGGERSCIDNSLIW